MNTWQVGSHFSFQILSGLDFVNSGFLPEAPRLMVVGKEPLTWSWEESTGSHPFHMICMT